LGVNRTMQEVPFERLMMKLKPVTCCTWQLCAAPLHYASPAMAYCVAGQLVQAARESD
jgi:hypothetical protein